MKTPDMMLSLFATALGMAAVTRAYNYTEEIVPGAFMVEYEDSQDENTFLASLDIQSLSADPVVSIDSDVFKGASYQFADLDTLGEDPMELLKSLPSVKKVWPVYVLKRPEVEVHWTGDSADQMPAEIQDKAMSSEAAEGFPPHLQTQVNLLHKENITGEGIKIGIIDDGVDYKNPALGGCFGEGCVVTHGWDYVGDADDFTMPDPDPFTDCFGHGTHVAGIISAKENDFGYIGAAPGASIGMYKIFDCAGSTRSDVLDAAVVRAFDDGNDIITASLGGSGGWADRSTVFLIDRIVEQGVAVLFAQGNYGASGPFNPLSPADGKNTLAIGSTDNTDLPRVFWNATYSIAANGSNSPDPSTSEPFGWTLGSPGDWVDVSLPLYVSPPSSGSCNVFANAPGDLSGYIVLLRLDPYCADWYQASFAAEKGNKYMLLYGEWAGEGTDVFVFPNQTLRPVPEAVGSIPQSTAEELIQLSNEGNRIIVEIKDPQTSPPYVDTVPNPTAGQVSDFSSWGPTFRLDMKPDIATPGHHILSSWTQNQGGVAVLSGTSMATPLAAAISALVLSARPGIAPLDLYALLSSTAKPIPVPSSDIPPRFPELDLAPTHLQGGGVLQAWDAVHATGLPSISKLLLNDTEHLVPSHSFSIKNIGDAEVTYVLDHQPALSAYSRNWSGPDYVAEFAEVVFEQESITVAPGQESTISLSVTPPEGLDEDWTPMYSGYIALSGDNGDYHSIPYLGAASRMRDVPIFGEVVQLSASNLNPWTAVPEDTLFTIPKDAGSPTPNVTYVYPTGLAEISFASALYELHVLKVTDGVDENMGMLPWYPLRFMPKQITLIDNWDGLLPDGTWAEDGTYALRYRVLKTFGDPDIEEDWEVRRLVNFRIQAA